jgi:hypothetical protein
LYDTAPAYKPASVCQFLIQKIVTTFVSPPPPNTLQRLFSVPQIEMMLKVLHFADFAEIQEAVTDELKKVKKE